MIIKHMYVFRLHDQDRGVSAPFSPRSRSVWGARFGQGISQDQLSSPQLRCLPGQTCSAALLGRHAYAQRCVDLGYHRQANFNLRLFHANDASLISGSSLEKCPGKVRTLNVQFAMHAKSGAAQLPPCCQEISTRTSRITA